MGPVLSSANADLRRLAGTVVATSANARAATTLRIVYGSWDSATQLKPNIIHTARQIALSSVLSCIGHARQRRLAFAICAALVRGAASCGRSVTRGIQTSPIPN